MKKILFLGSLYPDDIFNQLLDKKVDVGFAAQVFQKALLSGLDYHAKVQVISEVTMPTYPKCRQLLVRGNCFSHNEMGEQNDMTVSYINIPIIKQFFICLSYIRAIRKCESADVALIYEMTSRHLLSSVIGCRGIKKILIVPDLPEFMSDNKNVFYLLAKKIDRWIINFAIKRMDGFILFSKYMQNSLGIENRPTITIEGIFNARCQIQSAEKVKNKVALYSGKIEKRFGVYDLLSAFTLIKGEEYELWLCGGGDIAMVSQFAKRDKRIKYLGVVTHDEVEVLQRRVTILVNPRHSMDEFTLYSFPSKTMEYMASGTPTLMSRLKSIPDEYIEHLFLFNDESINGMSRTIKACLDMPEIDLRKKGHGASKFIIEQKNSIVQSKRIMDFIRIV